MTELDTSAMTEQEQMAYIRSKLSDKWWRMNNLYMIENEQGQLVRFRLRPAQELLFRTMWYLNIILKARQLGFSTAIDIYLLDEALFNKNLKCGIIAQDLTAAGEIYRTKIEVPFDNLPGWLQYLFGSAQTAYGYSITSRSGFADRAPKTWTFEGSNNGSSWTTLDTQTNITSWTGGDTKSYTIASPASYTYYRLNVSANNAGSLLLVEEMTINGAGSTNNLTVASNSIALAAVPSTVIPVIRIKHVDTATAGTDYNLYVSRDGGTTYSSAASLTDWATDPFETNVHIVYGAAVDVSGQPSGSNLRIKVITSNNKSLEIRDWAAIAYQ